VRLIYESENKQKGELKMKKGSSVFEVDTYTGKAIIVDVDK